MTTRGAEGSRPSRKWRILLAEDHEAVREGLTLLINAQPDMEVVGEAGEGAAAIARVPGSSPQVVVIDLSMPGMDGLQTIGALSRSHPGMRLLR